jgi:hypothetical protein
VFNMRLEVEPIRLSSLHGVRRDVHFICVIDIGFLRAKFRMRLDLLRISCDDRDLMAAIQGLMRLT